MIFLSPRRVSPFLAWGDFHARSRFARSTIPEDKWETTRGSTGSRGDLFVVRTSKPVENLRKMGYFDRVTVSLHFL